MNFILQAVRNKPIFLSPMDSGTSFIDYSSYGKGGGTTTSTEKHVSLVSGTKYSQVLTTATQAKFPSTLLQSGSERQACSLEAWVRVASDHTVEQQVIGNASPALDGIVINGTVVSLVFKFSNAPEARISYDVQQPQALHIVGTYSREKYSLYINGQVVGQLAATPEQQKGLFSSTGGFLWSGYSSSSTHKLAVSGVGMYATALEPEAVLANYQAGSKLPDSQEVLSVYGGDLFKLSLDSYKLFADRWWTTEADWKSGQQTNVAISSERLVPAFQDGVSLAGAWSTVMPFTGTDKTSVYGVALNWDGEGAVVEVSLTGATWERAYRGKRVNIIPDGFNPVGKEILIRVSFPGGLTEDPSFVDNLNVVGILSGASQAVAGRTITAKNASQEREYAPLRLHDNWGVETDSGGLITISPDTTEEATVVRSIELWIKRTTLTNPTLSMTGTTYINGASGTATLPINQWVLMHVVAPADIAGAITITGAAQIGSIGLFSKALTASEVSGIYSYYTGTGEFEVNDDSFITITEPANSVKIYAHDWSVSSVG